jgi:YYY domain-containing protein
LTASGIDLSILHRDSRLVQLRAWLERHPFVLPAVILLIGAIFRFYNLNWDDGHQLHPDEREIYMVVTGAAGNVPLGLPTSLSNFFDVRDPTGGSPLNPHFFSYGSLPFYLLGGLAAAIAFLGQHVPGFGQWAGVDQYANLFMLGRGLSALLDLTSVALVFLLGRRIFGYWTAVLAMALVAFTVLDIQLSHFYAVDTVLLPLCLATLLGAMEIVRTGSRRAYVLTGIALGAALATKTTALLLVIPMGAAAVLAAWNAQPWVGVLWPLPELWADMLRHYAPIALRLNRNLQWLLTAFLIAALTFCILEPYGVLDRTQLLHDLGDQTTFLVTNNPPFEVPFTIQYAHTIPYVYQFQNIVFWCMGLPLGLAAFAGVGFFTVRALRLRIQIESLVLLLWVVPYFLFVGRFFAKFNRYMLPITPVMTLLGAALLVWLATQAIRYVRWTGWASIAVVVAVSLGYSLAYMNIYEHSNTRVAASEWIYANIPANTHIAVEGPWDDTLPLPIGIQSPSQYPDQIQLDLYHNECDLSGACTPTDVQSVISNITDALQHSDYIIMSSERLVRSIPKLPQRFPVAIKYYNLLFQGKLNFRLEKVWQEHPQLGPIVVHDYPADESFHVYDHPIVRVFKRVGNISAARVQKLLWPASLPSNTASALPVKPRIDARLMLTAKQWKADQQGPTYDQMFPPAGFAAQHPILVWWLLLELLGALAFPLVFVVFARLRDRGFVLSKTIGLLILGWLAWITVSVGLTTFDRGLLYVLLVLLAVGSAALAYRIRGALLPWLREHWRAVVIAEAVFLVGFAFCLALRAYYPDLGHQWSPVSPTNEGGGRMGEKQMELAYLNAVVRSRVLPPLDPFFAHGYINYYYYGFFLVGTLCKVAQIAPATGFNLAVATFFALLVGTIYSIGATVTRRVTMGVLAALMVGVIGNLGGAWELIQNLMAVATVQDNFPLFGGVVDVISGIRAVLFSGAQLGPIDMWNPTRIIPWGDISEFPYFTYLFADLHPHLIAYPMTAAALALAVCLVGTSYRRWTLVGAVATGAILLGAIAATNPWDYPTYLVVVAIGALVGSYLAVRRITIRLLIRPAIWLGALTVLSALLYLPFKLSYQTVFDSGIGLTRDINQQSLIGGDITPAIAHDILVAPLRDYLEHFGLFVFIVVSYLALLLVRETGLARKVHRWRTFVQFAFYYRDRLTNVRRAARIARRVIRPSAPVIDPSLLVGFGILAVGLLLLQYFLLSFLVALAGAVVLVLTGLGKRLSRWEVFACVLVLVPIGLSIATQIFFVKDFLTGGSSFRMNTIFKFYNQAWVLYAVSSAAMLYAMFDRLVPAASMRTREVATTAVAIAEPMERGVAATLTPSAAALAEFMPAVTTVTSVQPVLAADGHGHAPYPVDGDGVAEPDGPAVIPPPPRSRMRAVWGRGLPASRSRPLRLFERYPWWSTALLALLLASLVYTYGGTMNRESFRTMWLPQNSVPLTLDGAAFMKVSYPQDYEGIQWLNAHVSGAPVIAEAHAPQNGYTWPSRVSMFTGLPDIINGIHEGEQRYQDELDPSVNCTATRNPGQCAITHASRDTDLTTLYSSPFAKDKWRIIRKYGVKYIFVGFSELHCIQDVCYSKAGLAAFKGMLGHGLKVAFRAPGVTIYEVTR